MKGTRTCLGLLSALAVVALAAPASERRRRDALRSARTAAHRVADGHHADSKPAMSQPAVRAPAS